MGLTASDIDHAAQRLAGHVRRTPFTVAPGLSRLCGAEVYCKREHLQVTGSFKERGACNKLLCLSEEQRKKGVVAASAGNHALGLSFHGRELGVPVTVVMPRFAPLIKVTQCREFGAEVILAEDTFDASKATAMRLALDTERTFVHAFDDADVIAGQGTVALEILDKGPELDALLVPVGGGGLLAGTATLVAERHPQTRLIAVEGENAPTLSGALDAGHVVPVPIEPSLADGLHVVELGTTCFDLIRGRIDHVEVVSEAEIARAIVRLMELEKAIVEGAGAVGLAALMRRSLRGQRVGLILSGGNIDLSTVSRIIERGLAAEGRLCKLTVELRDHPGSLAGLADLVAAAGANIQQIVHDRNFGPADISVVRVTLVVQTRDREHVIELERALERAGLRWSRVVT